MVDVNILDRPLVNELNAVRDELTGVAGEFMPELCHIVSTGHEPDGFGGTTETETELDIYLPMKFEARSTPLVKETGGGQSVSLSHDLTLPVTEVTKAITMGQKIVVLEGNGHGELVFKNPVLIGGSFSVFVKLAAEL